MPEEQLRSFRRIHNSKLPQAKNSRSELPNGHTTSNQRGKVVAMWSRRRTTTGQRCFNVVLHIFVYIWLSWQRCRFIENSDKISLFADPKTLLLTVKISRFLAQNWNQCNFCWRLLKFGCSMVTLFGLLKFYIIYVNSLTHNTYLLFTRKISQYFIQKWNLCNSGLFLPIWLP